MIIIKCFTVSSGAVPSAAAPWIAGFYRDLSLLPVIRVLSLTLVISGIKNVQQAYVSRTMQLFRMEKITQLGEV